MAVKIYNVGLKGVRIGRKTTAFPISDNFDSQVLNTDIWQVIQPTNSTIEFVSDGLDGYYLTINYDDTVPNNQFAGLVSNAKIPVGTKAVARVRRLTASSKTTLLGFGNYDAQNPTGLYNGSNLLRIENQTSLNTNFVLSDESGTYFKTELSVGNPTAFSIVEIHRISESHVQVYFNNVLEYENTNVDFGDDYSVFFGAHGHYNTNGIQIDYITISEL